MQKILFIIVDLKGTGKTHIGKIIEKHTNIRILRVEPIWIRYYKKKNVTFRVGSL